MLKQYKDHFFPNTVTHYVDLFCGGLTNALWIHEQFPNASIHINDKNPELIALYKALAKDVTTVLKSWQNCVNLWLAEPSKEQRKALYYTFRDIYKDTDNPGVLLFMLQTNFNGMWKAYKKQDYKYSTPPGTCTQKVGFFDRDNIIKVAEFLSNCTITCSSFDEVELPDGSFVYADPPYRDSVVDYQGGFTEDHQVLLSRVLTKHTGDFAYSNKDIGDGFFDTYFPNNNHIMCSAKYTAGRGTSTHDVTEILITNFSPLCQHQLRLTSKSNMNETQSSVV